MTHHYLPVNLAALDKDQLLTLRSDIDQLLHLRGTAVEPAVLFRAATDPRLHRFTTTNGDMPETYDTIIGFLAKRGMFLPNPEDTQRHGWKMARAAERDNRQVIRVPAPFVLQEQGIERVNAYPIDLLEEVLT